MDSLDAQSQITNGRFKPRTSSVLGKALANVKGGYSKTILLDRSLDNNKNKA